MSDEEYEKRMRENAERDERIKGYELTIANASTNLEDWEGYTTDKVDKSEASTTVILLTPFFVGIILGGLMMAYGFIDHFLFSLNWGIWEYWKELFFIGWLVGTHFVIVNYQIKTASTFWSSGFNNGVTCAYRQLNLAKKNLTKKDFEDELKRVESRY